MLIKFKADVMAIDVEEDTPLHKALWQGNVEIVKALQHCGADINAANIRKRVPLHVAAWRGHFAAAKTLVELGANVNATDEDGDTPLHEAARIRHSDILKILIKLGANITIVNKSTNQTPLDILIEKKETVLWSLVKEMNVDITWLDKVKYKELQDLLADEKVRQAEQHKTDVPGLKRKRSESVSSQRSDGFISPTDLKKHGVTHKNWNKGYQDGLMDSLDIRVVLLGPEGSGKSSLADTLTGQKFQHDTLPTKGVEQMEVVVKNAINWSIIDKEDLINDLQIRMLQEAKHCAVGLPKSPAIADIPTTPTFPSSRKKLKLATELEQKEMLTLEQFTELPASSKKLKLDTELEQKEMFTLEQFTELPALTEEYNPNKRYISIWDYGGQQVFHHTHGLFLSVEVVCLVVFDASKSLEDVPDRRCSDDHCPGRTGLDSICYWIELISHRVKEESTSDDDLTLRYPIFILVGTHIDLIDDDIEKAKQIAHQRCVPLLKSRLEDKPYACHIAGSKEGQLFDNGSCSIFFLSNLDELRDPAIIASLQETIIQTPPIRRRPIKFVKMERILLKLSFEEKVSIVSLTEVEEVAKSCGIVDVEDFQEAVNYLHQKGTILHFREVAALSDLAILCPQWLARLLTYVLTDLKHRLADATIRPFVKERKEHGFLREELLEWSVKKFNQGEVKRGQKKSNLIDKNFKVADLLIHFNLMVDVTNTALAKSRNIPVKKRLYLVPHLIPEKPLQHPADPYYPLLLHFSIGFIPDILIDQLIVKCAEWYIKHNFDFVELSYQCILLKLGGHQIYRLRLIREQDPKDTIELVIIHSPDLLQDEQEQAHKLKMEFVDTLKQFINDLMQQHMAVVADNYPVNVYVPCAVCHSLHIELEKITNPSKVIYCSKSSRHIDVTEWTAFWFPVESSDQKVEASIVKSVSKKLVLYNCFEINDHNITDQEAIDFASVLLTVNSVEGFDVSNTNLNSSRARKIVESLKQFNKIKFLRIHRNMIKDEFTDCLIDVIHNNDVLQELNISCNKFSTTGIARIVSALASINFIKKLDISKNVVSFDGIDNLTAALSICNTLQELNISHNLLSCTSLLKIAKGFRWHPSLQILNMQQHFVCFSAESEFLVDMILSTNFSLTFLNVCGRNIRPRFIDDYLSPPQKHQGNINRFVLHNLYMSRYLLMNGIASKENIHKADTPVKFIKVTEQCPLSKNDDVISYYVDYNGGTFYSKDHDLAIVVPPNAVSLGDCVEIQATASQLGHYELPDDCSPISSFYWVSASYTFKLPVYLIMSHYAKFNSLEDINNVCAMQACVRDLELTCDGKQVMKEVSKDSYCFDYEIGYCAFSTDHFCSICLRKRNKHISEHFVAMFYTYDANGEYCGEVCFSPANTHCMETIKQQYGNRGNCQHLESFCYAEKESLCISEDTFYHDGWNIKQRGTIEIVYNHFKYWEYSMCVLADLEKHNAYPPRFQICCTPTVPSTVPLDLYVSFTLCKKHEGGSLIGICNFVMKKIVRELDQRSKIKTTGASGSDHSIIKHFSGELCTKPQYSVLFSIRKHLLLKWKFIGYSLQLQYHIIENIYKRQSNPEEKPFEMLVHWMQSDSNPCYCKLISVLNEQGLSDIVDGLKASIESGLVHSSDLLLDSSVVNIGTLNTEPEMGDLIHIVIPKIKAHWEDVAFVLRFKIHDVETIRQQHNKDPKKCCKQLFEDWLSTNKGVTPKTWPTLLAKLKLVEELTTVVEEIKTATVTP